MNTPNTSRVSYMLAPTLLLLGNLVSAACLAAQAVTL